MAILHKQAMMVLHPEGTTKSSLAPSTQTSTCPLFVVLQQVQGTKDINTLLVKTESSLAEKSSTASSLTLFNKMSLNKMPVESVAASDTSSQECYLSAETTCNGITVTLDNNNMWNEFFRCRTEMILTKQGRRMFPYCRFRVSGLEPFQRYTLVMDMHPVDNYRYKWSDRRWEANGKAEPHNPSSFVHPDSPATGFDWMQNPVSFYKLKLTNNHPEKEGKISLNSMHRYLPRLHIIPADKAGDLVQLNEPDVTTFTFLQTEFFAVTAYQNLSITQLKIDYNPFAKGFREDANNSRSGKPKNGPFYEKLESDARSSQNITLHNLKTLFAKRNTIEKIPEDPETAHCSSPLNSELEISSSNRKRSFPEGLSELIKNAHVKAKRISSEKVPDVNDQQYNTFLETGPLDCKSENILDGSIAEKENNIEAKTSDMTITNVNVSIEEKISTLLESTDSSMVNTTNEKCSFSEQTTCSTPPNDVVTETSHPAENDTAKENSLSAVKPPDCEEKVRKKRAEPVPLPLLALFLQQLKSKTRSIKAGSSTHTNESSDSISVADTKTAIIPSDLQNTAPSPGSDAVCATTPDSPFKETKHCNILTSASPTEPEMNASTVGKPEQDPLSVGQPQLSENTMSSSVHASLSPNKSPSSSTPSSPDPFPPSMFSDRPVPRRKILNPFPLGLASGRPSPLLVVPETLPLFSGFSDSQDISVSGAYFVECENPSPVYPSLISNESEQSVTTAEKNPTTKDEMLKLSESMKVAEDTVAAPRLEVSKNTVSMEVAIPLDVSIPMETKEPCQDNTSKQPGVQNKADVKSHLEDSLLLPAKELAGDTSVFVDGMKMGLSEQCKSIKNKVEHNTCGKSQPSQDTERQLKNTAGKKCKFQNGQGTKTKMSKYTALETSSAAVPLQPNLEDVEGQLFVSFKSKKALKIHLGDHVDEEVLEHSSEKGIPDENKRIHELEMCLLHDLNVMRHRQVIHPVLQAVGLKLNLLDHSLAIDLQYLGVCLPIPPLTVLPDESSGSSSSQLSYVSRTGKTTDLTKIKGWRDKIATTNSSFLPGDAGQKNLSAFCSDMLDEYLESEGKFIDDRAASFSQDASVSDVAYELPTKSTSYVRTLDSVLKKQTPPATFDTLKASTAKSSTIKLKSKKVVMSGKNIKKSTKTPAADRHKQLHTSAKDKKISKSAPKSASCALSAARHKESGQIKTKKGSKTSQSLIQHNEKDAEGSSSATPLVQNCSSSHGSSPTGGRRLTMNKTLVKLMDVEDGAVWEGKHRTYITEERAAIALSCLITAEGPVEKTSSTIIKRRAPPCLNDFCRLGCICASLSHQRRQHHCCKPQCMLGCNCLRHKVLLKGPATDDNISNDFSLHQNTSKKNEKKLKKSKKRLSYILFEPEAASEPAAHVNRLWDQNCDSELDRIFIPSTSGPVGHAVLSPEQRQNVEHIPHPLSKRMKEDLRIGENQESWQDCARVRPFCWSKQAGMQDNTQNLSRRHLQQEMEDLGSPTQSSPSKRLEIVSKCRWATKSNMKNILHTLCEHMTQDRLDHPLWIGKFKIKLISKTLSTETDKGPTITYRVAICQPELNMDEEQILHDGREQLKAQLMKAIGTSKVKGLPLLSMVTSAGLLQAKKKTPGSSGCIIVNGKPYPQAKLELGKMGALHPANRLAAYITGRACPANKSESKVLTTTFPAPSTTNSTTVPTSHSTHSSTGLLVIPTVTKPLLGADVVQTVFNQVHSKQSMLLSESPQPLQNSSIFHINPPSLMTKATVVSMSPTTSKAIMDTGSKSVSTGTMPSLRTDNNQIVIKQSLPGSSAPLLQRTIKNIIMPPSASATGVSSSSTAPSKTKMDSQRSSVPVTKVVTLIISKPGSAKPKDMTTVCTAGPSGAVSSAGVKFMQPVNLAKLPGSGQKMMAFKAANGNFLFRDSSGKLIQLMPLSQYKALKSNVMPQQSYAIRFPTSSKVFQSKPQNDTSVSITASTTPSAVSQVQNVTSKDTTATLNDVSSTITSTDAIKPVTSQPRIVEVIPKIIFNPNTCRIVSQSDKTTNVVNYLKIIHSTASDKSSVIHPSQGFVQLAPPGCSIVPKGKDVQNAVQTSLILNKKHDIRTFQCSESTNEVVFTDHAYTNEMTTTTSTEKSAEIHEVSSACNTLEESLENVPIKQEKENDVKDAVEDTYLAGEPSTGSNVEEAEVGSECSEITEHSEMYDETETAELLVEEDLHQTVTGSSEDKMSTGLEDSSIDDDDDDDDMVDIETIKEKVDDFTMKDGIKALLSHEDDSSSDEKECEKSGITIKWQKIKSERKRRIALKNNFGRLMETLHVKDSKVSNIRLLQLALKEIESLTEQRDDLQKLQNKLQEERSYFLDKASRLSGKSEGSIHKKLNELITKEKSLGVRDKSNSAGFPKCNRISQNITQEDVNISTQNSVQSQQIRKDPVRPTQSAWEMNASTINPTLQRQNICHEAEPVRAFRERTRPNILSRQKPNVPEQVFVPQKIPLEIVSTPVIPSSQIILIQNPLQPMYTQPIIPGVSAVSLSVPNLAKPIRVENPHIFQSQAKPIETTTPVKNLTLPKIAQVVSLVAPKDPVIQSSPVLQDINIPVGDQTQASSDTAPVQSQQNVPLIGAHLDQLPSNVVPKKLESAEVNTVDALDKTKEESSNSISEQENESLMSLLDELVFLNQQLNNETSKAEEPQKSTESNNTLTSELNDMDVNLDECSLSPLLLKLDEDHASTSKGDETSDITSNFPERFTFGSDFPCNTVQADPLASGSSVPACTAKNLSPPPLLQMKVSGINIVDPVKNQTNLSWRPMPKLAPLGVKTLEAGQPKSTIADVHKTQ